MSNQPTGPHGGALPGGPHDDPSLTAPPHQAPGYDGYPAYGDTVPAQAPAPGHDTDQPYGHGPDQAYGQTQPYGHESSYGQAQAYGHEQPYGAGQVYGGEQVYGGAAHAYGDGEQAYGHGQGYGQEWAPGTQGQGYVPAPGQEYATEPAAQPYGQDGYGRHEDAAYENVAYENAMYEQAVPANAEAAGSAAPPAPAPSAADPAAAPAAPLTAAQLARAEGRSPIIEPGLQPAGLTALLALILCGTAAVHEFALVVPLVLVQAVTAAGWFRLNGMWPARQGILLAFVAGLTADVAVLAGGRGNAPVAILGSVALAALFTLVLQLRSGASADERMTALMATVTSAALTVVAAGHLAAVPEAAAIGGASVALAILVRALPLPTALSALAALACAGVMGVLTAGVGELAGDATTVEGAVIGLAAGLCALVGHRTASYDYPSRFVHMTAGVALPLAAAAPAVYLAGELLG